MTDESIILKKELVIDRLMFIHRFESLSDYVFEEKTNDFWEFLYVEKGTANAVADSMVHTLNKNGIIFHQPGEFHHVYANGLSTATLILAGFACNSPAMDFFRGKILETGPSEHIILGNIVKEAKLSYSNRLDDPGCHRLLRKPQTVIPFGSEQLIQMYLQQFLIQLIRNHSADSAFASIPKSVRKQGEDELFYKIISYMEEHIDKHLTIQQICRDNLIGRSLLQQIFRDNTGYGIIDYFSLMKINAAKQLIRSRQMNFSQIAEHLGYNSIHYFSRQFKKLAGMTPSEYASSTKPNTGWQESLPEPLSPDHNRSHNAAHTFPRKDI